MVKLQLALTNPEQQYQHIQHRNIKISQGEQMNNLNYNKDSECERLIVVLTHLGGIFLGFVPSLVVYLVKNDGWVKENARNALNWQLTTLVYYGISWVLVLVIIGLFLPWLIAVLNTVLCLVAAVRSSKGEVYKYPLTIEFITS
ncbi:MAG: DUF4870 domain-containing protein [Methylobacter sp.]